MAGIIFLVHLLRFLMVCCYQVNAQLPRQDYFYPNDDPNDDGDDPHDGDLRLATWSPYIRGEGRVEIFTDSEWRAICDRTWGFREADLVCLQLGLGRAKNTTQTYDNGPTTGSNGSNLSIAYSDVSCDGHVGQILKTCDTVDWDDDPWCSHDQVVSVTCVGDFHPGEVSLEGGHDDNSGFKKKKQTNKQKQKTIAHKLITSYPTNTYENTDGYICDNLWDTSLQNADVVCRWLGLGKATATFRGPDAISAGFTHPGYDHIFIMDNVTCKGYEMDLSSCERSQYFNNECQPGEEAAVSCEPPSGVTDVRLADGQEPYRGLVEIKVGLSDEWGTVCDNNWSINEADVVCQHLGYRYATATTPSNFDGVNPQYERDALYLTWYGGGLGPIYTIISNCGRWEPYIDSCLRVEETFACNHSEDVSISCATDDHYIAVRLVGGSTPFEGIVTVLNPFSGRWGTVCDDGWDWNTAVLVCKHLGYKKVLDPFAAEIFGPGDGDIALDYFNCRGHESSLDVCSKIWGDGNCNHYEDVAVRCSGPFGFPSATPPQGSSFYQDIRISGGSNPNEGRIEIMIDGEWGTVCATDWDLTDADVVCTELGYPGALIERTDSLIGPGTDPIYYGRTQCYGVESHLYQCVSNVSLSLDSDCIRASTVCIENTLKIPLRLVGGPLQSEGRVEILLNGIWGSVCHRQWDMNGAHVVCRQLGYDGALQITDCSLYGWSQRPIIASNVYCSGHEDDLQHCSITWHPSNCNHGGDAGVVCKPGKRNGGKLSKNAVVGLSLGVVMLLIIFIGIILALRISKPCKKTTNADSPPGNAAVAFVNTPGVPGNLENLPVYNLSSNGPNQYENLNAYDGSGFQVVESPGFNPEGKVPL